MKQRVLTASILIPIVLVAVFIAGFWPIAVLALVAYVIGARECGRMLSSARLWYGVAGFIAVLCAVGVYAWSLGLGPYSGYASGAKSGRDFLAIAAPQLSAVGLVGALLAIRGARGVAIVECASLWIAGGLLALVSLHGWSPSDSFFHWSTPILLALVPLWIGDTLAIFVGRAWGKRLLAPKISPKKTVEGGVANLIGCLIGALTVAQLIGQPLVVGVLTGAATGLLGQAGDLLESAMKRSAGVKDSGSLLPGHGGLLDRIDSILLSAPAVALVVVLLGSNA